MCRGFLDERNPHSCLSGQSSHFTHLVVRPGSASRPSSSEARPLAGTASQNFDSPPFYFQTVLSRSSTRLTKFTRMPSADRLQPSDLFSSASSANACSLGVPHRPPPKKASPQFHFVAPPSSPFLCPAWSENCRGQSRSPSDHYLSGALARWGPHSAPTKNNEHVPPRTPLFIIPSLLFPRHAWLGDSPAGRASVAPS